MAVNRSPVDILFDCHNVSPISPELTMDVHGWPNSYMGPATGGMNVGAAY